jgi:hypothetical protein
MKAFWVWQLLIANRQERKSEQIMLLLLSEEATNFKTRSIALASMVIEEKYTLGDSKYITIIKLFLLVNPFHFPE